MIRLNLLVILFIFAVGIITSLNFSYSYETILFHGFAHNKELHINLENPSLVKNILVQPGQKVTKGDLLIKVERASIALNQSDIQHDLANLQSQYQLWESNLKNSIRILKSQKTEKKNTVQSSIDQLESEMKINERLIKDIESINQAKDTKGTNPREIELKGLKSELNLSMKTFNAEIWKLEKELTSPDNPIMIEIEKLSENLNFVNEEENNLNITANEDGLVGSILCKIGEHVPAFTPFLTIYEERPNHVQGFVLESLLPKVNLGDTINIQSLSNQESSIEGQVIELGTRIVEIPSRLRKNPEVNTYGREVEIRIPRSNTLLQNEKVILKKRIEKQLRLASSNPPIQN